MPLIQCRMAKAFLLLLICGLQQAIGYGADDYPMVGTWVVDLQRTADSLGNQDKAKGFLAASLGIKIEMAYRPDGSVIFTKTFGDESDSFTGTYKIKKQDDAGVVIEVMTPRKGIRFEQIYQFPDDFVNQPVLMKGIFKEHYPESESFGLAQGEFVIEVFYENVSNDQKAIIAQQKPGGLAPVAVAGAIGQSTVEDDEVYYIEAKGIVWNKEVMGKDIINVQFVDANHCKMAAPGLGMPFIWQRIR